MSRGYYESGLGPPDETEIRLRNEVTAKMQDIVQAMLDDPEAVIILQRVGIHGDFTEEDLKVVFDRTDVIALNPRLKGYVAWANTYWAICQAAARRIVVGQFRSAYAEDARAFIFERSFSLEAKKDQPHINYSSRMYDFKISFDEFYMVLKEYAAWDRIPAIIAHYREEMKKSKDSGMSDPEAHKEHGHIIHALDGHQHKIFFRYGMINPRLDVWGLEQEMRHVGCSIEDRSGVFKIAQKMGYRFIKDLHA